MAKKAARPADKGVEVDAMYPLQIWMHLPGIFKNIKDKHVDQPAEKRQTSYCIHVLPLLNRRGWNQLTLKNVYTCKMFCAVL